MSRLGKPREKITAASAGTYRTARNRRPVRIGRMARYAIAPLVVTLLLCPISLAQSKESITLGSALLTLGTSRDAVITTLLEDYEIQSVGETNDSYLVLTRRDRAPAGAVDFVDGRLVRVNKFWGPDDREKGVDLAEALYGAVSAVVEEGSDSCTVSVRRTLEPGVEWKAVRISCAPGETVEVSVSSVKAYPTIANVQQVLEQSLSNP